MIAEPVKQEHRCKCVALNAVILCLMLLFCAVTAPAEEKPGTDTALSQRATLQRGERMYREGILPSGEPMQAFVKGDVPVPGTAFTCVSCHQRSGLGSTEGGVDTPATNGPELLKPFQMRYARYGMNKPTYFQVPIERPAYTDETLAEAIRGGVDSRGRILDYVMPRYLLDDEDMAIMIFYLKSLSAHISPGISDTTFRFATVMTDDVSQEARDAELAPLVNFINIRNNNAAFLKKISDGGKLYTVGRSVSLPPHRQYRYRFGF